MMDAYELAKNIVKALEDRNVLFDLNSDEKEFIVETTYHEITNHLANY